MSRFISGTYRNKAIKDVTYEVIGQGASTKKVQLRESGTNRVFWVTEDELKSKYKEI